MAFARSGIGHSNEAFREILRFKLTQRPVKLLESMSGSDTISVVA